MARPCLVLFLSCLIQTFGLYFFLKGFLLTRIVIQPEYTPACSTQQCSPRHFQRVVWLLIDALRYDFVFYNESMNPNPPLYINKMLHIRDYLQKQPQNTKLFRFIADQPTATMQRLKALTTGGLPSFIDISSNFDSYEIQEDNLIRQCKTNGLNITFLGDNTWMGMYPNSFDKFYPFPSLNFKDLDTVDDGVYKLIIPELKENAADFVIGHLLGVDHCGHTFGPDSDNMAKKLEQLDARVKTIFDVVDNNTIVFVLGDHGMTPTGDHGGGSKWETEAALLVYSPRPLFNVDECNGNLVVPQVDLVPTVSLLLGLPIPFSNLGMIIPDLFVPLTTNQQKNNQCLSYSYPKSVYTGKVNLAFLNALKVNSEQLNTFVRANAHFANQLPTDQLNKLYETADQMYTEVINSYDKSSEEKLTELADLFITYMKTVHEVCSLAWAKFDDFKIITGIFILILHFVFPICVIISLSSSFHEVNFFLRGNLILYNWIDCLSAVLILLHSLGLFSTSFIIYEQNVIAFCSQTLVLALLLVKVYQFFTKSYAIPCQVWSGALKPICLSIVPHIGIMICIRLTSYFYVCRDLQDECFVPSYLSTFKPSAIFFLRFFISSVIFCLTMKFSCMIIHECNELKTSLFPKLVQWMVDHLWVTCIVLLLTNCQFEILSAWIARIVYAFLLAAFILAIWKPFTPGQIKLHNMGIFNTLEAFLTKFISVEPFIAFSPTLAPMFWLLLIIWTLVAVLVAAANDVLFLSVSLSIVQIILMIKLLQQNPQVSLFTRASLCSLFGYQYFFAFGHQATVSSIRFEAGFIGLYGEMTSITLPIAGVLVGINMLGSLIITCFIIPLMLPQHNKKHFSPSLLSLQLFFLVLGSVRLLFAVIAAFSLKHHNLSWGVFAPRLLYEAGFQCLLNFLCLVVNLLFLRYNGFKESVKPL